MNKIKIFLCDNPQYKTTKILKKHWETDERFELITDPYFNAFKAQWADVTWMEWCETGMAQAADREVNESNKNSFMGMYNDFVDPSHKHPITFSGNWRNTKLINRAIDIDVYYGHYRNIKWENVDHLIFIAKHIQEMMLSDHPMPEKLKVHCFPLSVDMDNLTYKDRTLTHGKNIAFVNHIWSGKGLPLALQAFKQIVKKDQEFKLHIVGDWSSEAWQRPYIDHIISELGLKDNVIIQGRVFSIDEFLDDMDYVLSSSYKEAFSLITAEGMVKGLKPLVHNWKGAKDIWGKYVWTDIDELLELVFGDYNSEEYRTFVERYDKKYEIENADNIILNL